jgi:ribosome assembly protein RRB1
MASGAMTTAADGDGAGVDRTTRELQEDVPWDQLEYEGSVYEPSGREKGKGKAGGAAGAAEGEWEVDETAYDVLHSLTVKWPALSVALASDQWGARRLDWPQRVKMFLGTQAERAQDNAVVVAYVTNLRLTHPEKRRSQRLGTEDEDEEEAVEREVEEQGGFTVNLDEEEDDDDEEGGAKVKVIGEEGEDGNDETPTIRYVELPHNGTVNILREMPQRPGVVAAFGELGAVSIYSTTAIFDHLESGNKARPAKQLIAGARVQVLRGHSTEGWALDWSPVKGGRLLTGDQAGDIYAWEVDGSGEQWIPLGGSLKPYVGHSESVEALAWSPVEADVFASASIDGTIRVWDARQRTAPALSFTAHPTDVNVLSWNPRVTYLLASGDDDGCFRVWDLRTVAGGETPAPVASFSWHTDPVAGIEWSPDEESVLAVSSGEQATIWDLSLEADDEGELAGLDESKAKENPELLNLPPQLMFVHKGQEDMKEVHWHRHIPGLLLTTAADGINLWKPENI